MANSLTARNAKLQYLFLGELVCDGESHLAVGLAISGVRPEAELGAKHSLALEASACMQQREYEH